MINYNLMLFFLVLVSFSPNCQSWGWFSSSSSSSSSSASAAEDGGGGVAVAEFSMDGPANAKAMELVEKARSKLVGSNSCWQNAYQHVFAGCTQILANDEKRSRFAWHLSDCFQKDSARRPFPHCGENSAMVHCLKKLDDHEQNIYLEFLLETNSICYQLQVHAFKRETERLVNELTSSALYTEQKLDVIKDITSSLLLRSNQIHDSLNSMDLQVQHVIQTTKGVENQMDTLSKHSEAVYRRSEEIAQSQSELRAGQERMNEVLKEGVTMLHDAYNSLGEEVGKLRNEAIEIVKQVDSVGETMSSKFQTLQSKADDIENMAGSSLSKQQELLDGQSTALKGLQILTESQSAALEESRNAAQHLVDLSRKQQEELLHRQEQLHQVHDHLVENSQSILAAQEAFEKKQATMFVALDKLFDLHNAMLLESRAIKAFFVYVMSTFIIYMLTSTKQTYPVRANLYIGLCITFIMEVAIIRITPGDIEQQTWIINLMRSLYAVLAILQLLHAIYTYRDYEAINHKMIASLVEMVNCLQRNKEDSWEEDSDVDWSSWIEDELPEEVASLEDPDYVPPNDMTDKSIICVPKTRNYDLRKRHHQLLS
ncbi:unnamed protein product [Linum trigynum]|uniref:Protein GAMETE EXPRESSED 1 n=1 Tax=Linum trigynum TaxID=586398 RepID=A0AAV2F2D8_9ROSI